MGATREVAAPGSARKETFSRERVARNLQSPAKPPGSSRERVARNLQSPAKPPVATRESHDRGAPPLARLGWGTAAAACGVGVGSGGS